MRVAIRVKHYLARGAYVVNRGVDIDGILQMRLDKEVVGLDKDVCIVGAYIPPGAGSTFIDNRVNAVDMWQGLTEQLVERRRETVIVLLGDFNAHTGCNRAELDRADLMFNDNSSCGEWDVNSECMDSEADEQEQGLEQNGHTQRCSQCARRPDAAGDALIDVYDVAKLCIIPQ